ALSNLYLMTDLGVVDFLSSIQGVGEFERVRNQASEVSIRNQKIKVISLEDLIQAKEAMNREKDKLAAKELRAIRDKVSIDRETLNAYNQRARKYAQDWSVQPTPEDLQTLLKKYFLLAAP